MNKSTFTSLVNKYYLKGEIQTVKFSISSNELNIKFQTPTKEMLGDLTFQNFPLEDSDFVIYDTEQLLRLVNIINSDLNFTLIKTHTVPTRLELNDDTFKLSYFLSDIMLAPTIGKVKPITFDEEVLLKDHLPNLIKAKEALPTIGLMNIVGDGNKIKFIFGEDNNFSNKVVYDVDQKPSGNFKLPFNSDLVKNIFVSNKDILNDESKILINKKGLIKIEFKTDEIKTNYYLTRKI